MSEANWKILIIDDDPGVHDATKFALADEIVCGRTLQFLHAYSAVEAHTVIAHEKEVAVILLDVVMKQASSGLALVQVIRNHQAFAHSRIILRTGQAGREEEIEVMRRYQIDDFRHKSDLTAAHLLTAITSGIRAYVRSMNQAKNAQRLETMIRGMPNLIRIRSMCRYGEGVIAQCAALTETVPSGWFGLVQSSQNATPKVVDGRIIAALGSWAHLAGRDLKSVPEEVSAQITQALQEGSHIFAENHLILVIRISAEILLLTWLDLSSPGITNEETLGLFEIFAQNVGLGFQNVTLFERLQYLAKTDSATGLPNKTNLYEEIQTLLDRGGPTVAVASVELTEWDLISTGISPEAADRALVALAEWVSEHLPVGSLVARVGDNRLGVALDGMDQPFKVLAPEGKDCFSLTLDYEGSNLPVRPKVGWTRCSAESDADQLYREANLALSEAKKESRHRIMAYRADFSTSVDHRIQLSHKLAKALNDRQGLALHFQPQLDTFTGEWLAAEALCRWSLDDREAIEPSLFIPIAEASGQISILGDWVLAEAFRQVVAWKAAGGGSPLVSVNVSVQQLQRPGFLDKVRDLVKETAVDPASIELEITESTQIDNGQRLGTILTELRSLGFKVALDDFGTGFASLTNLLFLPLDTIKIDCVVTNGIDHDHAHLVLAKAIVGLAHDCGLTVVAEGVERPSQEMVLRDLGCDRVQGYLYAKPNPAQQFMSSYQKVCKQRAFQSEHLLPDVKCPHPRTECWTLMVVDDDSNVHDAIAYAMEDVTIFDIPLKLQHGHSAKDGLALLKGRDLPDVILLDMAMETPSAGEAFLETLKARSDFYQTQIIFCSGDEATIRHFLVEGYDIQACLNKNDLSRDRLVRSITCALWAGFRAEETHQMQNLLENKQRQLAFLRLRMKRRSEIESKLRRRINTDPLTGMASRTRLDETLTQLWPSLQRSGSSVCVLMIDVDFFKQYNDIYGHVAGDNCLAHLARAMTSVCRRVTDICARYGGEEFITVAANTDLKGGRMLARKVLAAVRRLNLPHDGNPFGKVTISIGVACDTPPPGSCFEELLKRADNKLYAAKHAGRNTYRSESIRTKQLAAKSQS